MKCPICNGSLEDCGPYGYLASHQSGEVLGHTYKCPHHEGFLSEADVAEYLHLHGQSIEDYGDSWEDVVCESALHHVSGSFYTDQQGNLKEGYPC